MNTIADSIMEGLCPRCTPGASLLIARGQDILLHRGYGLADVADGVSAGPETPYLIASMTKPFVCAAALLLVQNGKLTLDAPIAHYAPSLPGYARQVTPRHLMNHTSGIPDYFIPPFIEEYCRDDSPVLDQETLVDYIGQRYLTLDFAPGTAWAYSNSAYVILGQIIERAGDKPLTDLLKERIFDPLNMHHTRVGSSTVRPPGMALGYRRDPGGGFEPTAFNRTVVGWADGCIVSTCGDLLKWQQAIQNGDILSPASWEQVFTPWRHPGGKTSSYGLGWFVWNRRGQDEYWHTGSTVGYHGRSSCFPESEVSVILLMNSSSGSIGDPNIPFGRLIQNVIGDRLEPLPSWRPPPSGNAQAWVGPWHAQGTIGNPPTRFRIRAETGGRLMVAGTIRGSTGDWPLLPQDENHLWVDSDTDYYLSHSEAHGVPAFMTLHCHGRRVSLSRLTEGDYTPGGSIPNSWWDQPRSTTRHERLGLIRDPSDFSERVHRFGGFHHAVCHHAHDARRSDTAHRQPPAG